MTDQVTTPTESAEEQHLSAADIYRHVTAAINAGLPAPKSVRVHSGMVMIDLHRSAEIDAWFSHLKLDGEGRYIGRNSQPHPLDVDPSDFEEWTVHAWTDWHGWHLNFDAGDPITDEHRREWVESGQAAQRAEYVARQAGEQA
jgi:hypothetical protein